MPLFRRPDGDLQKGVSAERRLLPLLLKGRNESAIYHAANYDITKARKWLRKFNRSGDHQAATMFHLFMWAIGTGLHENPKLNRFVAGGRLYRRKGVHLAFAAKREFTRDSPLITVKVPFAERHQPFLTTVENVAGAVAAPRRGEERAVDKELKLSALLPLFLLRFVLWFLRKLDNWNLLPGSMIENDPLYSSAFVANLGSVGVDTTFHHLYEWGTVSVFAVLGSQKKAPFVTRKGDIEVRDQMEVMWTLDERVADGFESSSGLGWVKRVMEDPEKYIGDAETAAARGVLGPAAPPAAAPAEEAAA